MLTTDRDSLYDNLDFMFESVCADSAIQESYDYFGSETARFYEESVGEVISNGFKKLKHAVQKVIDRIASWFNTTPKSVPAQKLNPNKEVDEKAIGKIEKLLMCIKKVLSNPIESICKCYKNHKGACWAALGFIMGFTAVTIVRNKQNAGVKAHNKQIKEANAQKMRQYKADIAKNDKDYESRLNAWKNSDPTKMVREVDSSLDPAEQAKLKKQYDRATKCINNIESELNILKSQVDKMDKNEYATAKAARDKELQKWMSKKNAAESKLYQTRSVKGDRGPAPIKGVVPKPQLEQYDEKITYLKTIQIIYTMMTGKLNQALSSLQGAQKAMVA